MPQPPSRGLARRLLGPFTRPLDGRVADINRRVGDARSSIAGVSERVEELSRELGAYAATTTEADAYVGVETRRLQEALDALRTHIDAHEQRTLARIEQLEVKDYVERVDRAAVTPLERLDGAVANLVNHATGHRGYAAQAGLWFNPPTAVELREGTARLADVNERIVEMPYAFRALSRLPPGAKILEIGSAESTFALSLASLGYRVTALDLHPLPYTHPNLENIVGRFEDWDAPNQPFDGAFLISTIEHFGLGAYGEPVSAESADRAAIERVGSLLSEDGLMVLTTPYGEARVDELERIYDEGALDALLAGWTVLDRSVVVRTDERTWTPIVSQRAGTPAQAGVVMVLAAPAKQA